MQFRFPHFHVVGVFERFAQREENDMVDVRGDSRSRVFIHFQPVRKDFHKFARYSQAKDDKSGLLGHEPCFFNRESVFLADLKHLLGHVRTEHGVFQWLRQFFIPLLQFFFCIGMGHSNYRYNECDEPHLTSSSVIVE